MLGSEVQEVGNPTFRASFPVNSNNTGQSTDIKYITPVKAIFATIKKKEISVASEEIVWRFDELAFHRDRASFLPHKSLKARETNSRTKPIKPL